MGKQKFNDRLMIRCQPNLLRAVEAAANWHESTISDYVRSCVVNHVRLDGFGQILDEKPDRDMAHLAKKLEAMPSSLNDALRTMEEASVVIRSLIESKKSKLSVDG